MLEHHPEEKSDSCHSVFILWYADDLQIYWPQEISKETLYSKTGQRDTSTKKSSSRKRWLGHVFRKVRDTIFAKTVVSVTVKLGRRTNKAEMKSLSRERHGVSRRELSCKCQAIVENSDVSLTSPYLSTFLLS